MSLSTCSQNLNIGVDLRSHVCLSLSGFTAGKFYSTFTYEIANLGAIKYVYYVLFLLLPWLLQPYISLKLKNMKMTFTMQANSQYLSSLN